MNNDNFIIFSVSQGVDPYQDQTNHDWVRVYLHHAEIEAYQVSGMFQGQSELSFVVPAEYEDTVQELCVRYSQRYYLKIDDCSRALLVSTDTWSVSREGVWRVAYKQEDIKDYTYDPETNTKYTVDWDDG